MIFGAIYFSHSLYMNVSTKILNNSKIEEEEEKKIKKVIIDVNNSYAICLWLWSPRDMDESWFFFFLNFQISFTLNYIIPFMYFSPTLEAIK